MKKDDLGNRMKEYEFQYSKQKLLPLVPICARIDGRSFHNFTKGLKRPYDERLSSLMVETTKYLVEETNANCGYTQSDEISLVWFVENPKSQIFFDGKLLKMTSMMSAMTTAFFNSKLPQAIPEKQSSLPLFDARIWSLPNSIEVANYFLWREMDAVRNSLSMAASHYYSHKQLHKKSSVDKHEMLHQKGVNWNDYPSFFKRGTYVQRKKQEVKLTNEELEKLPEKHEMRKNPVKTYVRATISVLEIEPLSKIENKADVILFGAEPIYIKQ